MKKNFYLQHPLMAMNDPRMQHLVEVENLKGSGAYWVIIEKLALLPEPRATFEYLRPFCNRKIPFSYLKKIILEYQLFVLEEDGYFSPAELNPVRKKDKKLMEKERGNGAGPDGKQPDFVKKEAENTGKWRKEDADKPKKTSENEDNPLPNCQLNEKGFSKKEENIKDNITTTSSSLTERKKTAAANNTGGNLLVLHRIIPWEESLKILSEDSSYIDLAFMHCGYGALLKRRFKDAIEFFRRHIILYHKQDDLPNEYEVYRYFANFTAAGSRTSAELRNHLMKLDEAERLKHPDAYRYEKLIGGRRTYNGCPLPNDAPPRPNDRCLWNDITRKWV